MYTMHTSIGALCFALASESAFAAFPNSNSFQNLFRAFLLPPPSATEAVVSKQATQRRRKLNGFLISNYILMWLTSAVSLID